MSIPAFGFITSANFIYSHNGSLNFTGSSGPSSIGLPALPKEIFWS